MLSVEFEGQRAIRLLDDVGDRLGQPDEMLDLLVDNLHEYEREVFATSGRGRWPALSPKTVDTKGSSRILVDSGALLDALTGSADLLGDEAVVEADVAYAGYLKRGTSRMPRRDPAPEPPADTVGEWAEDLLGWVLEGHR